MSVCVSMRSARQLCVLGSRQSSLLPSLIHLYPYIYLLHSSTQYYPNLDSRSICNSQCHLSAGEWETLPSIDENALFTAAQESPPTVFTKRSQARTNQNARITWVIFQTRIINQSVFQDNLSDIQTNWCADFYYDNQPKYPYLVSTR